MAAHPRRLRRPVTRAAQGGPPDPWPGWRALWPDDVLQRGSPDREAIAIQHCRPGRQLFIRTRWPSGVFQAGEDVEGAGVSHPRRHASHVEGRTVDLYRQAIEPRCSSHRHGDERAAPVGQQRAGRVRLLPAHHAVGVLGRSFGAVPDRRLPSTIRYSTWERSRTSIRRRKSCGGSSGSSSAPAARPPLRALRLDLSQPLHHRLPRVKAPAVPQDRHVVGGRRPGMAHTSIIRRRS